MAIKIHLLKGRFLLLGFIIGAVLSLLDGALLAIKFTGLPPLAPLWYTQPWGEEQLARPALLWLIPGLSLIVTGGNAVLAEMFLRKREKVLAWMVLSLTLFATAALNFSLFRIIKAIGLPEPLPWFLEQKILLPFILSSLVSTALTPLTIKIARRFGVMDDPQTHKHPAMLLKKPTPRMGSLPVYLSLLFIGLIFLPRSGYIVAIYLGAGAAIILGLLDDKYNLNPYLRLAGLFLTAAIPVIMGVSITFIGNPLNDVFRLDLYRTSFNVWGARPLILPADILTIVWIVWVMNMLSWSNGVDGQFPGIVAIAAVVIGLLGKRFVPSDPAQWAVVILSFVTAGAVLGTLPYTWHPSSILYGFGATGFGLILATLSILSTAKVATSTLILMVPTLDAFFAIVRRLRHKRSPVWGDRGHLHHKLLDLGWNQKLIAVFYWALTAVFGLISLFASGREKILAILSAGGAVAFLLTLVNLEGAKIQKIKFPKKEAEENQDQPAATAR